MKTPRLIPPLCAVGLALSLSACSAAEGEKPTTPTSTPPAAQVKSTPLPAVPNMGKDVQGVAKDVKITECPTNKGEVTAKGTATNSGKAARDISVIVIWLKNNSGDPLGSGIAMLKDVPAGKSANWSVKAKVVDQADRCVLNAQAGQLTPSTATASPKPTATPSG